MKNNVRVSADPERHVRWLHEDLDIGLEKIFLHNVSRQQERFVETFGDEVLLEFE